MDVTMEEVLQFVAENDVKFIRLAFCDIFGVQKNISVMPDELPRAFQSGVSLDASAVEGFPNTEESDLFLKPDPSTLAVLPWRPSHGRVIRLFCNIFHPDGTAFAGDGRALLKEAVGRAAEKGLRFQFEPVCEFYLFQLDENGNPTKIPQDAAGYCDIAPRDKGENVRRDICLSLEEMGIRPVSSHHERGPGQNEIHFRGSDALSAADNFITFKSAVRTIAARDGLYATFMPKPLEEKSGSGLHIHLSVFQNDKNLFQDGGEKPSPAGESFLAGILRRVREITVFLNPLTNSYARLGRNEAPAYIAWSRQNHAQSVRLPAPGGDSPCLELRSPDPLCNPYLAFTLLISAGMEGLEENLPLCLPSDPAIYPEKGGIDRLPENLNEAVRLALNSVFLRRTLPEATLTRYLDAKADEYARYMQADNKTNWEYALYF